MAEQSFPDDSMALTHILVVEDIERSKQFYIDILGAQLYREYGGSSLVLSFLNNWLLVVTGGDPTADKPNVRFAPSSDQNSVDHAFTIRVRDCEASYRILKERGADFLTPPYNWGAEIRCFFRDPDGHLFEISQVEGLS